MQPPEVNWCLNPSYEMAEHSIQFGEGLVSHQGLSIKEVGHQHWNPCPNCVILEWANLMGVWYSKFHSENYISIHQLVKYINEKI